MCSARTPAYGQIHLFGWQGSIHNIQKDEAYSLPATSKQNLYKHSNNLQSSKTILIGVSGLLLFELLK